MTVDAATDDIESRLGAAPPFDALAPDRLAAVAAATRARAFEPDVELLHQGGAPSTALYLISSGTAQVLDGEELLDAPGPGEVFGELSLLAGMGPTATVRAGPDGMTCLVVDGDVARDVLGTAGGIAFVEASLRRGVLRGFDHEPGTLAADIDAAQSEAAAIATGVALPERACALLDDGADAVKVGREIGGAIDALTRRFLAFALDDLGDPPAPWAWMALGSEARMEQALHTDQDHALAFDPGDRPDEEVDPWFATLAERVTASLEASGIPRCTGDAMATTGLLRRSVRGWTDAFTSWMVDVGPEGSLMSSVVFDHRVLAGPLDIGSVIETVVREAPERFPGFIRHLAHRALDRKPPTGFAKGLVVESKGEHAGRLDIKHGGVAIIANLARCDAIRVGSPATSTTERLDAATDAGVLDDDARGALEEAFRLLWQIRLEHQAKQHRAGAQPDDFVDPETLGPIQRLGLKEAFRIVGKQQQQLASELNIKH